MFDRLVESEPQGAVRSRRNYFAVTTIGMSVVSLTAIVASIFADDYSIGTRGIELVELIAPVEMAEVAPEKPQPRPQMQRTQQTSTLPQRAVEMARVEDTRAVPTAVSITPNKNLAIPEDGRFTSGPIDTDPATPAGEPGRPTGTGSGDTGSGITTKPEPVAVVEDTPPSVEVKKAEPPKVKSGGVLNGEAIDLPKPVYSAAAKAVHAQGKVTVQVLLDESGRVVSASAVDGNVLLRSAAVDAARRARFTPTKLSGVPVKVTGVIVYNFVA